MTLKLTPSYFSKGHGYCCSICHEPAWGRWVAAANLCDEESFCDEHVVVVCEGCSGSAHGIDGMLSRAAERCEREAQRLRSLVGQVTMPSTEEWAAAGAVEGELVAAVAVRRREFGPRRADRRNTRG
jgi:hypothetical protein